MYDGGIEWNYIGHRNRVGRHIYHRPLYIYMTNAYYHDEVI